MYIVCTYFFNLFCCKYRYSKTKKFGIEPKIMAEINFYSKLYIKKKKLSHKLLLSLVLLAMLLKYSRLKIQITIKYLISNNLKSKETI